MLSKSVAIQLGDLSCMNFSLASKKELQARSWLKVAELRKSERKLQEELNAVYKDKAKLAQDYVASSNQLQIVRENFEQHDRMLTERANTIKELKSGKKEMSAQLAHLRDAHEEAAKELLVTVLNFFFVLHPFKACSSTVMQCFQRFLPEFHCQVCPQRFQETSKYLSHHCLLC